MTLELPIDLPTAPFGLPAKVTLQGLSVDVPNQRVQVVYNVEVQSPDGKTTIQKYGAQYVFGNEEKNSMHQVRGLTPEQLPRLDKVPGDNKFTRWFGQLEAALTPAIAAEIQDLLTPTTPAPTAE